MRSWSRLAPLLALVLGACEEGAVVVRIDRVPVLPAAEPEPETPASWEGLGCGSELTFGPCLRVSITAGECAGGGDDCTVLLDGASVPTGDPRIRLDRDLADRPDLRFDVATFGADRGLVASGARRAGTLGDRIEVSLAPVGASTGCLAEADPVRRAFHTATLLPTGKILLLGGLAGPFARTLPEATVLEETVTLFDPATQREEVLSVEGQVEGEVGVGFFRAFHRAALVGRDGGRFVVRVTGGVRGSSPAVVLSRTRETPLQLIALPVEGADLAPTVEVVVDPQAGTATVREAIDGSLRATAFAETTLEDELGRATGFFAGGGLGEWSSPQRFSDELDLPVAFEATNANGNLMASGFLLVPRVAAVAVGLGPDRVLVWGGNVGSVPDADPEAVLAAEIGEIHDLASGAASFATVTAAGGVALPPAAGYAAAAVARVEGGLFDVVIAGGDAVSVLGAVSVGFPAAPVYVARVDPEQSSVEILEIECRDRDGQAGPCDEVLGRTRLLSATRFAPGRVLLAGGNASPPDPSVLWHLAAVAAAGIVTVTADGATLDVIDVPVARWGHTATLLDDGSVLLFGGLHQACAPGGCESLGDVQVLGTPEIWNPGRDQPAEHVCAED